MGKKNKGKDPSPARRAEPAYPLALPQAVPRDVMIELSDDELVSRLEALFSDMAYVGESCSLPLKPWEVEIAFYQRELGWRQERRRKHDVWQASQQLLTQQAS